MDAREPLARARTGLVAIVGRPNVGKSTLLNALVGEHVSITSRKPQTTRHRVLGIVTQPFQHGQPARQFIFVDTPGFQRRHRSLLTRRMNETVRAALAEVDATVLVIDARGWTREDEAVLELLPPACAGRGNVVLALNKTDKLADRNSLLPVLAASARRFPFAALVPISAEKGRQLDDLLAEVGKLLPEGEPLFDADQFTDRSLRFLAAELIREKAFRLLGDELPYGLTVTIDRWEEREGRVAIAATLVVDRESHKPIVIGAGGAKLREIGRLARIDIERLVGVPVFLQTHVRVRHGWSNDERALRQFGYG